MSNNIFEAMFEQNIEKFVNDFNMSSRKIYTHNDDKTRKLIHPGEFGTYREEICRNLLLNFIPGYLDIGNGFVMSSEGFISNQSDIIIFDKENAPLIRNLNYQRFFSIENIAAVGEIKSKLSKKKFIDALTYLSAIKRARINIKEPYIKFSHDPGREKYDALLYPTDQIVTFIICEKLNFNIKTFNFDDFYKDDKLSTRIDMILSLEDGLLAYENDAGQMLPYSNIPNKNFYLYKETNKSIFFPIKLFLINIFTATKCCTRLSSEIGHYIQTEGCVNKVLLT